MMEMNENVVELMQVVRDAEMFDLIGGDIKLSKTESRLLREVALEQEKGNEIISSELAKRLGITRSAVSQLVTKLEEREIIVRASSPVDRKIAYIRLSEKSKQIVADQCARCADLLERVSEKFGKKRMNDFISSCGEFFDILKKEALEMRARETEQAK